MAECRCCRILQGRHNVKKAGLPGACRPLQRLRHDSPGVHLDRQQRDAKMPGNRLDRRIIETFDKQPLAMLGDGCQGGDEGGVCPGGDHYITFRHRYSGAGQPRHAHRAVQGMAFRRRIVEEVKARTRSHDLAQRRIEVLRRMHAWRRGLGQIDNAVPRRRGTDKRMRLRAGRPEITAAPHFARQQADFFCLRIGTGHRAGGDAEPERQIALRRQSFSGLE